MRTATRLGLMACAFALLATAPALAQVNVTFQVDMNAYITSCQFDPATGAVSVPGSFNDWNTTATPLADPNTDGIYTATVSMAPGDIEYKFYATPDAVLGWDAGDNRTATITTDVTLPVATPNWTVTNICGAQSFNYEIVFTADMRVQIASGLFNPSTQSVAVAGAITDWGGSPVNLAPDPFETGVFTGIVQTPAPIPVPGTTPYKFVIRETASGAITTWESGDNREVALTGNEPDADGDGYLEATAPRRFFEDVTFDDVLNAPATVVFEVDLRPAFYRLEDHGSLPVDASGGGAVTAITGLSINGPFPGRAVENPSGVEDWAGWGPEQLGSIPTRQLRDDGTNGDLTAGDQIYTLTYNFNTGTARRLAAKLGVNGYDNEAAFGNDHNIAIDPGSQRVRYNFGCIRRPNGTFENQNGPGGPIYAPYLLVDNAATPPTCTVQRGVSNEPGAPLAGAALSAAFPNPAVARAQFTFTLDRAQAVAVRVFDVTGRVVATLVEGAVPAGERTVTFEAGHLPAGLYLYRLETAAGALTGRLTVAR